MTESKELSDKRTGNKREVDIVIEYSVGGHSIIIGVECVDWSRPAGVEWIEQIARKHEDLNINKTVVVSSSGFRRSVLTKARAYNIDTLTFREAENNNWPKLLESLTSIHITQLFPRYIGVRLDYFGNPPEDAKDFVEAGTMLCGPDGSPIAELTEFGKLLLNKIPKDFVAPSQPGISPACISSTLTPGCTVMTAKGRQASVLAVHYDYEIEYLSERVPLKRKVYGSNPVLHGSTESEKEPVDVVISTTEAGIQMGVTGPTRPGLQMNCHIQAIYRTNRLTSSDLG